MATLNDVSKALECVLMGGFFEWEYATDKITVGRMSDETCRAVITLDKGYEGDLLEIATEGCSVTYRVPKKIHDRIEFGFWLVNHLKADDVDLTDWCIEPKKKDVEE